MVVFPNCKINIGLNILGKRPDGFHNLETVFYPVPLKDVLEVIRAGDHAEELLFTQSGEPITGEIKDNLCVKGYQLLKKDFPHLPAVQMHLHKAIPMGAGLGGGSADGSFTLKLLNNKFNLGLSTAQLTEYALQLGSDCPFFINNKPCFATGRGDQMEPLALSLAGHSLLLINPGIHINTGWAFGQLKKQAMVSHSKDLSSFIRMPIETWRQNIVNDFERVVFEAYPQLQELKEKLYGEGAVFASMSGSGSTFFGLFKQPIQPDISQFNPWFTRQILL